MKFRLLYIILCLFVLCHLSAQTDEIIPVPQDLEQTYPRLYITQDGKAELEKTIKKEDWASEVLSGIHQRIDKYVEQHKTDAEWMPSRLQMYWNSKALDVYVNDIYYSHTEGEAPVPTVKFTGSRDYTTNYVQPSLEDIVPYMDDPRGMYLPNKMKEGRPFEWVEISKTGGIVHKINEKIINLARDAAFIYWLEGDEAYAQFAFDVFDTYMQGMYYRNEPIDITHGHIKTLVGLSCFQVIHEKALISVAELYDFLHPYVELNHSDEIATYDATIKKWNENIIRNGVPQNNWNLHQAKRILKAAMVLQDDKHYADGKGRGYYIDYVLNQTSIRQWSMHKFMSYGYDYNTGVWGECPGYSQGVTKDLTNFIRDFYNAFDFNILPYTPIIPKAVKMLPQYLFPNNQIVGFGDTYYGPIYTEAMSDLVRIAQKSGDEKLEEEFTAMYRLFEPQAGVPVGQSHPKADISSLFASQPLVLNDKFEKGKLSDYITQTFYAPNVSWHVQRMGWGQDAMMVSLNASLGNHMHANGINMELYAKGLVQGADPGKGAGYLQPIYLKYYSQFPAHNTVMVDGCSTYREMLSHHAFDLVGQYPKAEEKDGFYADITYSNVLFLEPETQSDQSRIVSMVKTGETTGYYIDIFRSGKQRGGDKFHDYYYHNLGQSLTLTDVEDNLLPIEETQDLTFSGGHLNTLDYLWDKKSIRTNEDYKAQWKIDRPEGEEDVYMNLWMKGTENREVFTVKSPPCKSFKDHTGIPYDVDNAPYLALVARQHGEAWEHPFVSVYESFTSDEGSSISSIESIDEDLQNKKALAIKVNHKSGRKDLVLSSYDASEISCQGVVTDAQYSLVANEKNADFVLFMGNGSLLEANGCTVQSSTIGNVVLEFKDGDFYLHNEVPVIISNGDHSKQFEVEKMRKIKLNK